MKTQATINVTIHAEGDGHEEAGAILVALEKLLDSDLVVGPMGRRYTASVTESPYQHCLHTQ
ncbi:MAG TPA: hypothetical protein VF348_01165 [Usitatibacter sp.]